MSPTASQRTRDVLRSLDHKLAFYVMPNSRPRSRVIALLLATVALIAASSGSVLVGYNVHHPTTITRTVAAKPASPDTPENDIWYSFRHKPSYVGQIDSAALKPGHTYWLPRDTNVIENGNYEWFIADTSAPVLAQAADAGPYPFKVTVFADGTDYEFQGGSALIVTLPDRYDYQYSCCGSDGKTGSWSKGITGPAWDLRDTSWDYESVIPVAQVLPAPGLKLSGYDDNTPTLASLPMNWTGYVDISTVKFVRGTRDVYFEDYGYTQTIPTGEPSGYLQVTRTKTGLVVCPSSPERSGYELYAVARNYQHLAAELPGTVSNDVLC